MADFTESRREDMHQETADEFLGGKSHYLDFVEIPVIAPVEGHQTFLKFQDAVVGNGDPMGVAAKVDDDFGRVLKRRLAVSHPVFLIQIRDERIIKAWDVQFID